MSLTSVHSLLRELSQRDVLRLEISGGGEPLDHPEAADLFQLINELGFRVGLITNGYPLVTTPSLIDPVLACADWVRISVDAFTEKSYRKVHGTKSASYNALRTTIKRLMSAAQGSPKIGLKVLLSKANVRSALRAVPEALALGVDYLQFKFLGNPLKLAIPNGEARRLSWEIEQQIREIRDGSLHVEFVPPFSGSVSYERCLMTFLHPVIDWDGTIYLCAFFAHRKKEHSIGNLHDSGFFAHWDDPEHRRTFDGIDPRTCIPNCPMRRYNQVVEFIRSDSYRFGYI